MDPRIISGGVPLMSQEEQQARQQAALTQMMFNCYFSLIPTVAADKLTKARDGWQQSGVSYAEIANTAWEMATVAVERATGAKMQGPSPLPQSL
jgi:hypothetical protein